MFNYGDRCTVKTELKSPDGRVVIPLGCIVSVVEKPEPPEDISEFDVILPSQASTGISSFEQLQRLRYEGHVWIQKESTFIFVLFPVESLEKVVCN